MKNILQYVKDFYRQESKAYFLLVSAFIAVILYLNYFHGLETNYVAKHQTWLGNFCGYFLLYFIIFFLAFALQLIFHGDNKFFRSRSFWLLLCLAPLIFSFRVNLHEFYNHIPALDDLSSSLYQSFDLFMRTVITIIPIYIFWKVKDAGNMPFYGVEKLKDYKPYWIMLLLMVPLIAMASTQQDFLAKYPRSGMVDLDDSTDWLKLIVYELSYGLNFLSIELFFRGFLVLALLKYCGLRSVIPIACFYVVIHLGKPMGEAISSFFGGALLGIITYHTKSIWGGLIIHIGIAWLMEIGGAIGNYIFDQ